MTQEDKDLLLKDLAARFPYGVSVYIRYNTGEPCYGKLTLKDIQWFIDSKIETIKPYLHSLSSMTEEERKEYHETFFYHERYDNEHKTGQNCSITFETYDWLNKKMFDYRNLIPKGLALEAPEGMYK